MLEKTTYVRIDAAIDSESLHAFKLSVVFMF